MSRKNIVHRLLRIAVDLSTLMQDEMYQGVDSGDLIKVTEAQIASVADKMMQAVKSGNLESTLKLKDTLVGRVMHSRHLIFQLSSASEDDETPLSLGPAKQALRAAFNLARKEGNKAAMSDLRAAYTKLKKLF